jgi:tyrosyl-tRNA synthetase
VGVEEEAHAQFGKVMSISDDLMWRWFELLSQKSTEEIAVLKGGHPMDAKVALAKEIVARFHGAAGAEEAHAHFKNHFGHGKRSEIPDDAPTVRLDGTRGLLRILVEAALAPSNSEARRQVQQSAVSVNGEKVTDAKAELQPGTYAVRVGKTRWAKIILS